MNRLSHCKPASGQSPCAGTVCPSRPTHSSCCHNGGTLYSVQGSNITKYQFIRRLPSALPKLKLHQNSFSVGALSQSTRPCARAVYDVLDAR